MKLLIVDASAAVYQRLIALLGGIERFTALAVTHSLRGLPAKCREFAPDAVVLDIDLPDGQGLGAIQIVRTLCPGADVFVFSNHVEFRNMALARGATGFFDKSLEFEQLVARLGTAMPLPV